MITRRNFLASAAGTALAAQGAPKRNLLFLSVDDMNDWVGCLGHPLAKTPNIDRLAKQGVLFANAHCASPLCNPSRAAILTGQRPSTTGMYNNDQFWPPVLPNAVVLPQYLRQHGYLAKGAGKVFHHTAGNNPPDRWDDFQLQVFDDPWYRRADWYPWNKRVPAPEGHPFNGLRDFQGEFDWGVLKQEDLAYGDQRAVDYGLRHFGEKHDKPWFLAVGLWHPHIPMFSPQKYWDLYEPGKIPFPNADPKDLEDVPAIGQQFAAFRRHEFDRMVKEGKWKECLHAYLAAISFADAMVGRLLDGLDKSPYASNTTVILWSDNGWHLGEKRHFHKGTLWQRATHIPLVIRTPEQKQAGVARKQAVSLLDLYPTILDLCGLPARKENEGISLRPLLENAQAKRPPAVITYLQGNHAVRDERYRYIRYNDGTEEFYDCQQDPLEHRNLASNVKYRARMDAMRQWMPAKSVPAQPERTEFDFDFATHTYKRKEIR
ncbi:MAG: sulfatase [Bryobacter sp.]|nr:sulfatase [Bryobacter sp.]